MLRSTKDLMTYRMEAKDGVIGKVSDFYFDDARWTVRYVVADTHVWRPGRRVLISPVAFGEPDWVSHHIRVNLTKNQIEESPDVDEHKPLSRQLEEEISKHFRWPMYWQAPLVGPLPPPTDLALAAPAAVEVKPAEPNLQSVHDVSGYHIAAQDGEIGHLDDFVVDTEAWIIRYVVVDTRNWIPGKKVLISPDWIRELEWSDARVKVDLTRDRIKNGPEYEPNAPVNRQYETRLYDFYGRPHYWA